MLLRPDYYHSSFCGITPEFLKKHGIRGLLLDIDNTLCEHDNPEPLADVAEHLKRLKKAGIACCLVSNNQKTRVELLGRLIGLPYVYNSLKPLSVGINKAIRIIGLPKKNCAMVGDQLFTDIAGGNAAGITTILVVPASDKEINSIKIKRSLERRLIKGFERRGLKKQ